MNFFWITIHLASPSLFICVLLLAIFYAFDSFYWRREELRNAIDDPTPDSPPLGTDGKINFVLLVTIIALVLMSGVWKPQIEFDVMGTHVALQNLVRDGALIAMLIASLVLTPKRAREGNAFDWAPMEEVAKLFAAIFITIAPVITILRAGEAGAFAGIVHAVSDAQGKPIDIPTSGRPGCCHRFWTTRRPISCSSISRVATPARSRPLTPRRSQPSRRARCSWARTRISAMRRNFMVKAIAESRGVLMPGFFGYLAWSGIVLLPLFAIMGWLFSWSDR